MKVGDLVRFKPTVFLGDHGVGTVMQFLTGGSSRKNNSAEVHWPKLNKFKWHVERHLEVVDESR